MWALRPPVRPAAMHARQRPCRTPVLAPSPRHAQDTRCMASTLPTDQHTSSPRKRLLQGAPPIVRWWDEASLRNHNPPGKTLPSLPCTVIVEGMADANAVSKAVIPQVPARVVKHQCQHATSGRHHHHGRRHPRRHARVSHMAVTACRRPHPLAVPPRGAAARRGPRRQASPPRAR